MSKHISLSNKNNPTNFKHFLSELRKRAKTEREKGELFEKAIREFLQQSPEYSFENVWLWSNWPDLKKYNFSKKDLGIDLVAKEQETGTFWAIQCKCFDENRQVNKQDIDSFFTLSGKNPFKTRLIVTTTANWGTNALEALKNQTKECKILDLYDLEKAECDWNFQKVKRKAERKYLRDHQNEAVQKSAEYFETEDRGKLIMACGTGKTFTSLRIVEKITPKNGHILFLAPSISLISQTLREYAWQRKKPQRYFAVCSDAKAGKDTDGYDVNDLQISPTTDPKKLAKRLNVLSNQRTVVFSTYQSLKQIKKAQSLGAPVFDLVICDEAHRTTGVEAGEEINGKSKGNYFTSINDENYVKAKKRLYMTATPKIYSEKVKNKAKKHDVEVHSMDEEKVFGKEIYRLDFSTSIEKNLLVDYKVVILSINEQYMSDHIQDRLKDTQLNLNDASRLVGCYKALRDQGDKKKGVKLSRAVGFLNTIQASKEVKEEFQKVVEVLDDYQNDGFTCETKHIDGTDSSIERNKKLDWLKENAGETERGEKISRILFNSKCLTEGVDVPNLSAVMFLHPRKSQVDVVQAVGRIMRKQEGKKYGYVILPVVIPAGKSPEQALNDNETYKVVWQVLNALRSHDSKFDSIVNNLELNKNKPEKIKVVGIGYGSEKETKKMEETTNPAIQLQLQSIEEIENKIYAKIVEKCGDRIYEEKWAKEIEKACKTISTRIQSLLKTKPSIKREFESYYRGLKSCINEDVTEGQAISMLAEHLITKPAFDKIFENYQFSANNPVSKTMKKVLDRLDEYGFSNELKDLKRFYEGISRRLDGIDNSASRQKVIKELYENFIKTAFPKTAEKLGVAYTPVEIVDFILRSANEILKGEFNKSLTNEGVHVIDPFVGTGTFLNRLIQMDQGDQEYQVIEKKDLPRKFQHELHANEILLLPYYVASINIEEAYYSRMGGKYTQFPGITLTDTFNMYEPKDNIIPLFKENKKRIEKQKNADIQVIVGNPPYSSGQKNENDGNKNTFYPKLHNKIQETYVKESTATYKRNLYDSYIKAIRWATDRIGDKGGIIGFVHNASLVNERSIGGLRKSLVKEFDSIYCFNLRGNARITKGDLAKKEGGTVFGQASRCPVAITFLVKNPENKKQIAEIKYYDINSSLNNDIEDSLSREKKLKTIKDFACIKGIGENWTNITPDQYGDWINQRDNSFYQFMPIGDKKTNNPKAIFDLYSLGVATNRDSWVYNFSKNQARKNMQNMIHFYNQELDRLKSKNLDTKNIDKFIDRDEKKIKWTYRIKEQFIKRTELVFQKKHMRKSNYRPWTKSYLYFESNFNERHYQLPKIFPTADIKNKVICVSGVGAKTFSVLIVDSIPDLNYYMKGGAQCFPLYRFSNDRNNTQLNMLKGNKPSYAITDSALNHFKNHYKKLAEKARIQKQTKKINKMQLENKNAIAEQQTNVASNSLATAVGQNASISAKSHLKVLQQSPDSSSTPDPDSITKEDIFYYIYGLLHSEDYRNRYKSSLDKALPHIPLVPEFWEFESTGRKLADLHLNYENQSPPKEVKVLKNGEEINLSGWQNSQHIQSVTHTKNKNNTFSLPKGLSPEDLKVTKMKMDKNDQSKIRFNEHLTITNIPQTVWEYKVDGWSAPKQIIDRYQYKKNNKTGLIDDPNTYSEDPAYILKLLLSVMTVSIKTQELIKNLPPIDFDELVASMDKAG